jgi:hypothetical protein
VSLRLFGDERRFFTGEIGAASMDDETVARYRHRLGAVLDATRGAWDARYLTASLDDGRDTRVVNRASLGVSAPRAHADVSYRHSALADADDSAVARAEAAAWLGPASAVLSYAQSGTGGGVFFPSARFDAGALGDAGYAAAAPENSMTSAEVRLWRLATRRAWFDAGYRYENIGSAWANDLAAARPGSVANEVGVYASHRRYALDGRIVYRDELRHTLESSRTRSLEATARAFLRDNSQMLVRGGMERREFRGRDEREAGFVQAGYRRELQRFMGGVHALLDGIGDDAVAWTGVETRINWNPTSALYARCILADQSGRTGALYARLEFRPTTRTWVTIAYGWAGAGDGPYLFDGRDAFPAASERDLVSVTIRGDF